MTTNVTVHAVDGPVVIYLQDGSTLSVEPGEEKFIQLPEGEMCTVSDTPPKEGSAEGPPPGYVFANAMIDFWQAMVDQIEDENPDMEVVNPL